MYSNVVLISPSRDLWNLNWNFNNVISSLLVVLRRKAAITQPSEVQDDIVNTE